MNVNLYQLPALKYMENLARGKEGIISLSQGIPFLPSDDSIRLGVIDALLQGKVDKYSEPQGLLALRKLLSQKLQDEQIFYLPEEFLITAGAIEALSTTLLFLGKDNTASSDKQGEIIIPTPTYASYFRSATVAGLSIKTVTLDESKNWSLDIHKLESSITSHTKAILLCNPNNPTGNIYDKENLRKICAIAQANKVYVILDEVYGSIHWQQEKLYSPVIEEEYKDNIIRIVSFSKDFSLTGWRVGFLQTNKKLIKKLLPIHDSLVNCAPVISQYAAMACLLHEKRIKTYTKNIYTKQRKVMGDALASLSSVSNIYPQGSYFFFPKIHGITDDVALCLDILEKVGVAVVPGSDFGPGGEGHIRLCFGRSPEEIDEGLKRLKGYFEQYEK